MTVKGNHPLAEIIACKLFSIEAVGMMEAMKMTQRAADAAIEYHEAAIERARAEERERVADYVDGLYDRGSIQCEIAWEIADAIRSMGGE